MSDFEQLLGPLLTMIPRREGAVASLRSAVDQLGEPEAPSVAVNVAVKSCNMCPSESDTVTSPGRRAGGEKRTRDDVTRCGTKENRPAKSRKAVGRSRAGDRSRTGDIQLGKRC